MGGNKWEIGAVSFGLGLLFVLGGVATLFPQTATKLYNRFILKIPMPKAKHSDISVQRPNNGDIFGATLCLIFGLFFILLALRIWTTF